MPKDSVRKAQALRQLLAPGLVEPSTSRLGYTQSTRGLSARPESRAISTPHTPARAPHAHTRPNTPKHTQIQPQTQPQPQTHTHTDTHTHARAHTSVWNSPPSPKASSPAAASPSAVSRVNLSPTRSRPARAHSPQHALTRMSAARRAGASGGAGARVRGAARAGRGHQARRGTETAGKEGEEGASRWPCRAGLLRRCWCVRWAVGIHPCLLPSAFRFSLVDESVRSHRNRQGTRFANTCAPS